MSSTIFSPGVTKIPHDWANDANSLVYDVFAAAQTVVAARAALGLKGMALQSASGVDILGGTINGVTIGNEAPGDATFSSVRIQTMPNDANAAVNRAGADSIANLRINLVLNTLIPAKGSIIVRGDFGPTQLGIGANGDVLQANTASAHGISWGTLTQLIERNPLDDPGQRGAAGDIQIRTGTEYARLPIGEVGEFLQVSASSPQKVVWGPGGGGSGGGNILLERDVPVIGTDVGAVPNGFLFLEGLSFTEFVELVSTKVIPPSYTGPSMGLSSSPVPGNFEVGTSLSITLNQSFNQANAGAITAQRLLKNSVLLANSFPHTDTPVIMTLTPVAYQGQTDYGQGPILNDNMGNPNPAGRIQAGTVNSPVITFVGKRLAFYGTPGATPTSSAAVRALSNQSFNSDNNSGVDAAGLDIIPAPVPNFIITIPPGATRVVFAYPADRRVVASVKYQELSNSEVKSNFVQTTVSVEGAAGFAPVNYRVYTYIPVEPFSLTNHYKVFI